MKTLIVVLVGLGVVAFLLLIAHAHIWSRTLEKRAKELYENPDPNIVIRTDGLFPRLGARPPESAMWRVRTGWYNTRHGMIVTYRYDRDQLQNADLDSDEVVDRELRAMEEHGKEVLARNAD